MPDQDTKDNNITWPTLNLICNKDAVDNIIEFIQELIQEEDIISICYTDAIDEEHTDIFEPKINTMPLWEKTSISIIFDENVDLNSIVEKINKDTRFTKDITYLESNITENKAEYYQQATSNEPLYYGKNKNLVLFPNNEDSDESLCYFNLSPGLAFGTGQHETTTLCLNWLADNIPEIIKQNSNIELLDFGCGSGILSIASAKLGVTNITAIDHDPQAIIATDENAKNNKCSNKINAIKDNNIILDKKFPILIANILANTLIDLSDTIINHVEKNGFIILSGILQKQADEVIKEYTKKGVSFINKSTLNDWVGIVFKKNN